MIYLYMVVYWGNKGCPNYLTSFGKAILMIQVFLASYPAFPRLRFLSLTVSLTVLNRNSALPKGHLLLPTS